MGLEEELDYLVRRCKTTRLLSVTIESSQQERTNTPFSSELFMTQRMINMI